MPSSSELIGDGTAKLTIEIPVEDLQREYQNAARRIAQRQKIPGFRPGKAPPRVVERLFGEAAIKLDAIERLVPRTFDRALAEQDLEMADQPEFEYPDSGEGELDFSRTFTYSGTVPLVPTVTLGNARTISLRRRTIEVGEEEIVQQLEAIRSSRAEMVDIEDSGRELGGEDIARFDFRERVDGEDRIDREGLAVSMSNPGFADGFADQVLGMRIGDEKEFELAYSDSSPIAAVAGKSAEYRVKLVGLTERTLPELNDEFAASVSEVESVEELRDQMREEMTDYREREDRSRLQNEALAALIDKSDFTIAERLVRNQAQQLLQARVADLTRRGMALETFLAQRGMDDESFRQQAHEDAEDMIRNSLTIREFASAREIEVGPQDVETRLTEMFASYPAGEQEALRNHYLNQMGIESLAGQILQERVLDQLLEEVNVQDPLGAEGEQSGSEAPTDDPDSDQSEAAGGG